MAVWSIGDLQGCLGPTERLLERIDEREATILRMRYGMGTDQTPMTLKEIGAKGQKFDPHIHEAMCKRSVEDQDDEIVLAEFEKGYMFKERVLRTAKVEINQK